MLFESSYKMHAGDVPLKTPPVAIDMIAHTDSLPLIMTVICD